MCKRLGTSRLHELHKPKFSFVSRIEFIRSKFSNFLLMYPGSASGRLYRPGSLVECWTVYLLCRLRAMAHRARLVDIVNHSARGRFDRGRRAEDGTFFRPSLFLSPAGWMQTSDRACLKNRTNIGLFLLQPFPVTLYHVTFDRVEIRFMDRYDDSRCAVPTPPRCIRRTVAVIEMKSLPHCRVDTDKMRSSAP